MTTKNVIVCSVNTFLPNTSFPKSMAFAVRNSTKVLSENVLINSKRAFLQSLLPLLWPSPLSQVGGPFHLSYNPTGPTPSVKVGLGGSGPGFCEVEAELTVSTLILSLTYHVPLELFCMC